MDKKAEIILSAKDYTRDNYRHLVLAKQKIEDLKHAPALAEFLGTTGVDIRTRLSKIRYLLDDENSEYSEEASATFADGNAIFYGYFNLINDTIRAHEVFGHGLQSLKDDQGIFADCLPLEEGTAEMLGKAALGKEYQANEYFKYNEIFATQIRDIVTPAVFYNHLLNNPTPEALDKEITDFCGNEDTMAEIKIAVLKWEKSSVLSQWMGYLYSDPRPIVRKIQSTFTQGIKNCNTWDAFTTINERFNAFGQTNRIYTDIKKKYIIAREQKTEQLPHTSIAF